MAQVFFSFRENARGRAVLLFKIAAAVFVTFFFLTSVKMLTASFDMADELNPAFIKGIMGRAASPLIGVLVGVFVTSLLQSSSATTSMLVGFVAATSDAMPIEVAVPMVMGANIGSTVTNTIVAMGHVTPPVALTLYIGSGISGVPVSQLLRPLLPFWLVLFVLALAVAYVPWLTLAIPGLLG